MPNKKALSEWSPRYTLTPKAGTSLMQIEAAKTVVESTPLPWPRRKSCAAEPAYDPPISLLALKATV